MCPSEEHKPHSVQADVEEAFGVLEKKHHPTWEIECVQATAILRHHFESLFEQYETLRDLVTRLVNEEQDTNPWSDIYDVLWEQFSEECNPAKEPN